MLTSLSPDEPLVPSQASASSSAQWESSFYLLLPAHSLGCCRGKEQMYKIFPTWSQENGLIRANFLKKGDCLPKPFL